MKHDALFYQNLFFENYDAITSTPFSIYPRLTFQAMGMPSPRQYYAYSKLIKRGFGNDKKFLDSELTLADISTENIIIIDNYYDQVFKNIVDGENYNLFITSGFFYGGSNKPRRARMMDFLRGLALKRIRINIHTQDKYLEGDFFKFPDKYSNEEKELIKDKVNIEWNYYRIDIHYIILENLKNIECSHFFLEYPHSEFHIYRLDIHFTYNQIKEKFYGDPEKIFRYLLKLREGDLMEIFFYHLMKHIPILRNHTPDWGIAFGF